MDTTEAPVKNQIKPWKINGWMRNKMMWGKNAELYENVLKRKGTFYIHKYKRYNLCVLATRETNSGDTREIIPVH